ncbi:hypothetical protein EBR66_04545 [bacterium]|nr:hypothetical protein [bacterium]
MGIKSETGRHVEDPNKSTEREFRNRLIAQQERDTALVPKEIIECCRRFARGVEFLAVRDTYQVINTASQTHDIPQGDESGSFPSHEQSIAQTNEITEDDFFYIIARDDIGNPLKEPTMDYRIQSNTVTVNIYAHLFSRLVELDKKGVARTPEENTSRTLLVVHAFQILFHELGHAYSFLASRARNAGPRIIYNHIRAGTQKTTTRFEVHEDNQGITEFTKQDGTFWMEGWNDIQATRRMLSYLETRSLQYEDIVITKDSPVLKNFMYIMFISASYGHASWAIWAIANKMSESGKLSLDAVLDRFDRIFQTKQGRDELIHLLKEVVGEDLKTKIFDTDALGWDSKILAHEIMEKVDAPAHWQEHLLDMITRPEKN